MYNIFKNKFKDANLRFDLCVSEDLHQGSELSPCIPVCCGKGEQGGNEMFFLHSRWHKPHCPIIAQMSSLPSSFMALGVAVV